MCLLPHQKKEVFKKERIIKKKKKAQSGIISHLEGLKDERGTLGTMQRKEAPWWDANWSSQDRKPHEIKNSTIL